MSVTEERATDMASVLLSAYNLGDMINGSAEVSRYLYWKDEVEKSDEVHAMLQLFNRKKDLYEEAQRFGHFHPNYHSALDEAKKVEKEMEEIEAVRNFKQAEAELDDLLFTVSKMLANAVSDTIKVPSNNPLPEDTGCGSGGKCGCG